MLTVLHFYSFAKCVVIVSWSRSFKAAIYNWSQLFGFVWISHAISVSKIVLFAIISFAIKYTTHTQKVKRPRISLNCV